jgi:hypothetical protein
MTGGRCDHWRGLIAVDLLGQLVDEDRTALTAHLDGCAECRQEKRDLTALSAVLPAADPDHFDVHDPPLDLQSAVFDRLHAEARRDRRVHHVRYVMGGAAAAVVVAALVLGLTVTNSTPPARVVALRGRAGVHATARLTTEPWGTAIELRETGQAGDQVLTVSMRTTTGTWWEAGTYRTVGGRPVAVDLACALPASKIVGIWVHNGAGHTVLRGYVS